MGIQSVNKLVAALTTKPAPRLQAEPLSPHRAKLIIKCGADHDLQSAVDLGLDTRPFENRLLDLRLVGYFMAIRKLINPDHKNLSAVYACAGADLSSFILSTDAPTAYFIDQTPLNIQTLKDALKNEWDGLQDQPELKEHAREKYFDGYNRIVMAGPGGTRSATFNLERKLLLELKLMDVRRSRADGSENIFIDQGQFGEAVISFNWAYAGRLERRYHIHYLHSTRLDHPRGQVPGSDIYFEKAAMISDFARYRAHLAQVAENLNNNGWLLTNDFCLGEDDRMCPTSPFGRINSWRSGLEEVSSEEITSWKSLNSFQIAEANRCGGGKTGYSIGYGWDLTIRIKLTA
jgi:hypothetical protein